LGPRIQSKLKQFQGRLDIATQVTFKRDAEGEQDSEIRQRGQFFFDLCISSNATSDFLIVVEVKIKPDKGLPRQVDDYGLALKKHWAEYEGYILTLTPATSENTSADAHISWQEIEALLAAADSNLPGVYKSFAAFLKREHITYVKLPELSSELIQHLRAAGPFLTKARDFFRSPTFKPYFRPLVAERPVLDSREEALWYGIHGNTPDGWKYAGFYIGEMRIAIYAEFMYTGNRRHIAEHFDAELDAARKAGQFINPVKEFDEKNTTFVFAREVPHTIDSQAVLAWFEDIFSKMDRLAAGKP